MTPIEALGWIAAAYLAITGVMNLVSWVLGIDIRTDDEHDPHLKGKYESTSEKLKAVKYQYNITDDDVRTAVDSYRDYRSDDEAIPYETR